MIKYKLPEVDKTSRPGDTVEKGSASIPRGAPLHLRSGTPAPVPDDVIPPECGER